MNNRKHTMKALALLLLTTLLSSCATIISGTTAPIYLEGDVDEPLTIVTSHSEYNDVSLPTRVKVKRRNLDGQHIRISSENYAYSDIVLKKTFNPWSIASASMYGIPLVVDLTTHASENPMQDHFFITPAAPSTQADSLHRADSLRWAEMEEENRKARVLSRQLPERYPRHELRGSIGIGACQSDHDRNKIRDPYMERFNLGTDFQCGNIFGDAYPQAGAEYHYRLNRKWEVGMLANWGRYTESYFGKTGKWSTQNTDDMYDQSDMDVSASEDSRFFVIAPSVRYTWMESKGFRCYSRIALGALRNHNTFGYIVCDKPFDLIPFKDQKIVEYKDIDKIIWRATGQLTAIGGTAGFSHFQIFGELGYGSLGIVRLGASILF
ncbi:MAG: hypothetical protein IJR71_04370 [Prevotella sp.]|nr:hypothetical protein [Prevotella sp.]